MQAQERKMIRRVIGCTTLDKFRNLKNELYLLFKWQDKEMPGEILGIRGSERMVRECFVRKCEISQ